MVLENISANFLGDSITEGRNIEKPFHQRIAEQYHMKVARNYGIGGTRIARKRVPSVNPRHDLCFCDRFAEMDPDAELIVVFGGTNDYGHGDALLGTPEDRTPDTFWGACHYLFRGLIERYPTARIVVMTPLHRAGETNPRGDGYKTENLAPLLTYVEIVRAAAAFYSLPIIDLWESCGIQPDIPASREAFTLDGLHPNEAGHARMADYIGRCLSNL